MRALAMVLGAALCAPLCAQAAIRLAGVPDRLHYPLPDGANRVVTATLEGARPKAVWLATSSDASARVPLVRAGDARYEINLASAEVEQLLRARGERGQFRIFATVEGDETLVSPWVRFTFAASQPLLPSWVVVQRDARLEGFAFTRTVPWLAAADAVRIEWHYGRDDSMLTVEATAGDAAWPFSTDPRRRLAVLELTPEIRAAWNAVGTLSIGPEGRAAVGLRARPARLAFLGLDASVTIVQRHKASVPGSRGWAEIAIDDITGGQVLLEMRSVERTTIIPQRSVREGDAVPFRIGEEDYTLRVTDLVNRLIGDDHGVFTIAKMTWSERDRIDALLARLEVSRLGFVRGDETFSGAEAAAHLRRKLAVAGAKVETVEEFIHRVASRSSVTGKPYRIRLPDGRTIEAQEWLRGELEKVDAGAPKKPGGSGKR